jgi:hypothetical protein
MTGKAETIIDVRNELGNPRISQMIPLGRKAFVVCERMEKRSVRICAYSHSFKETTELFSAPGIAIIGDSICNDEDFSLLIHFHHLSPSRFRKDNNISTELRLLRISGNSFRVLENTFVTNERVSSARFLSKNCIVLIANEKFGICNIDESRDISWHDGEITNPSSEISEMVAQISEVVSAPEALRRFKAIGQEGQECIPEFSDDGGFIIARRESAGRSVVEVRLNSRSQLHTHIFEKDILALTIVDDYRFGIAFEVGKGEFFASICDTETGHEIETIKMSNGKFIESYGSVKLGVNSDRKLLVFH